MSSVGHKYAKAREAEAAAKEAAQPALAEEAAANRAFGRAQRELEDQRLILVDLRTAKRSEEEKARVQERLELAPEAQAQGPAQDDRPRPKSKSIMR